MLPLIEPRDMHDDHGFYGERPHDVLVDSGPRLGGVWLWVVVFLIAAAVVALTLMGGDTSATIDPVAPEVPSAPIR